MINKQTGVMIMSRDHPILIKYGQLEGKRATDSYTLSLQANLIVKNKLGT